MQGFKIMFIIIGCIVLIPIIKGIYELISSEVWWKFKGKKKSEEKKIREEKEEQARIDANLQKWKENFDFVKYVVDNIKKDFKFESDKGENIFELVDRKYTHTEYYEDCTEDKIGVAYWRNIKTKKVIEEETLWTNILKYDIGDTRVESWEKNKHLINKKNKNITDIYSEDWNSLIKNIDWDYLVKIEYISEEEKNKYKISDIFYYYQSN